MASTGNKRIAINTFFLYFRMLLLMAISLYTSRIVLDALGVVDYGLYNVVGGVVVALGFLTGTLNTTSSRFITVALSHGHQGEVGKTFGNVLTVSLLLAIIVFITGETAGLWFLYNKMQIPEERLYAAFWVYQMSIVTVMVNIVSTAYNACIIAHEKMKAFAYLSLIDGLGKLLVAFVLANITRYDKLIVYGFLLLLLQILNRIIYTVYCARHFPETRSKLRIDKPIFGNMFKFISWASYGSFVSIGFTQGVNILLNLFFGPAVNAARAVSVQVQNAIVSFTTNFQMAINPQLIQSVSTDDFVKAKDLLKISSKISFFLLCMIGIPLINITPFVLNLWLKDVPEHTVWFVRLMIIIRIFGSIANPLRVINQANGNIRKFQLYEGTVLLTIVPLSYVVLSFHGIPELVFIVHLVMELLSGFIRIKIVLPQIRMSISEYLKSIYLPLSTVLFFSLLVCVFLILFIQMRNNILLCITTEICVLLSVIFIGLSREERTSLVGILGKFIAKKFNR